MKDALNKESSEVEQAVLLLITISQSSPPLKFGVLFAQTQSLLNSGYLNMRTLPTVQKLLMQTRTLLRGVTFFFFFLLFNERKNIGKRKWLRKCSAILDAFLTYIAKPLWTRVSCVFICCRSLTGIKITGAKDQEVADMEHDVSRGLTRTPS